MTSDTHQKAMATHSLKQENADGDKIYTDGFPDRWAMIHRDDATLLGFKGDLNPFGSHTIVCTAPKMAQGEEWLETAKAIAIALDGTKRQEKNRIMDEFCDECGIGPPYGENDKPMPNVRAAVTWKCDQCEHTNERPKEHNRPDVSDAAAIAIDKALKNTNGRRLILTPKFEALLVEVVTIAIEAERGR